MNNKTTAPNEAVVFFTSFQNVSPTASDLQSDPIGLAVRSDGLKPV